MRIAIVTHSARMAGGVESYLDAVIPMLEALGHQISLLCESDAPSGARAISRVADAPAWCVAELGAKLALESLRQWQPEVVYSHGLIDDEVEARALTLAPSMVFAHDYRAICISGSKTFSFPGSTPCVRRFGARCVSNFYPRRCGGLSPLTMLSDCRGASRRLTMLRTARAVIVASEYVRGEFLRNGLSPETVHCVGLPIVDRGVVTVTTKVPSSVQTKSPSRLVFAGRMESLKGGQVLLEALPAIASALARPVVATFAGDGRARLEWARRADEIVRNQPQLRIEFTGWMDSAALDSLFDSSDLLVLPSLWPEPFGLVGSEAGIRGLPTAAFATGGIPEWLSDGVNGTLARGPSSARSLADAVVRCLRDPVEHLRLRRGAIEQARRFSPERHLNALMKVTDLVRSIDIVRPRALEPRMVISASGQLRTDRSD
jgi:glycosyltransferase involved in cell wall biosynthesis